MTDVKAPTLPFTVHADFHHYRKKLGIWRIVLAVALTLIILLRFGVVVWLISIAAIVLLLGVIFFAMVKRSLTIDTTSIVYKNMLGREIRMQLADIEAAKVFINFYDASFGMTPRVSIAQKDSTKPIVLVGLYWKLEDIDKLLAALKAQNVTVEYYEDMVSYREVAKILPAYATYVERHTGLVAFIATMAILVVCVGIALIMTVTE